jgi:monofunctional biosynthetic peptidoglycan transglycosylase
MGNGKKRGVKKSAGKKRRKLFHGIIKWLCGLLLILVLMSILQVSSLRYMDPPFFLITPLRSIISVFSPQEVDTSANWRSFDQISPHMKRAVLAAEDQRFLTHKGFDFVELNQALKDMATGKGYRGASTITMQTARTVFLWPDRSWTRKGLEAYYTVLLEIFLPKRRILEVYLNTVDWGKDIRGVEAAARSYFHVSADRLSREQAALLAAVLPSPHRWSPNKPNARVLRRQQRILQDMKLMPLPKAR